MKIDTSKSYKVKNARQYLVKETIDGDELIPLYSDSISEVYWYFCIVRDNSSVMLHESYVEEYTKQTNKIEIPTCKCNLLQSPCHCGLSTMEGEMRARGMEKCKFTGMWVKCD